jgi:hypothetical protein
MNYNLVGCNNQRGPESSSDNSLHARKSAKKGMVVTARSICYVDGSSSAVLYVN